MKKGPRINEKMTPDPPPVPDWHVQLLDVSYLSWEKSGLGGARTLGTSSGAGGRAKGTTRWAVGHGATRN